MGTHEVLVGRTISEIREQARQWERAMRNAGLDVELGYDRERVREAADGEGYVLFVRAHS